MRNGATAGTKSGSEVGVLNKALDLLEGLPASDLVTVAELADSVGVNKAAAYRILNTLERRGYVVRGSGEVRRYTLGPALRALSKDDASPSALLVAARPRLRGLWDEFGETVNLGVLSNDRVLYLDILESDQGLRTTVDVGSHDAIHSTALGKVMLAALADADARAILARTDRVAKTPSTRTSIPDLLADIAATRVRGYALDDEENEAGARCVAAAVTNGRGGPLGALSVSGPSWRLPDAVVERIGRRLRGVCEEVSQQIG
ncbi:MAG TPA: IclR family transcriptional regulator [Acidimicrobiia bacterium]|nr:IclR family transcriptional regulator [Acidimicrobiia bacterium]